MLSTKDLELPAHACSCLPQAFRSVYRTLSNSAARGQVAYRLELPAHLQIHPVFYVDLLSPCYGTPPERPPPVWDVPTPEYEVEQILRHRWVQCKLQVLVLWLGYPPRRPHGSWLPTSRTHRRFFGNSICTCLPSRRKPLYLPGECHRMW